MRLCRSADDAPRDYRAYASVEDARRQEAVQRRREEPRDGVIDGYGTRGRRAVVREDELVLPKTGYNALAPQQPAPRQRRAQREQPAQAGLTQPARYPADAPARQPMAQAPQSMPPQARQPMPPQARQSVPPQARQPMARAQAPLRQPAPPSRADAFGQPYDTPYQVVRARDAEDAREEAPQRAASKIPWAAIACALLAGLCALLWIKGSGYETERIQTEAARIEQERALLDRYTLSYRSLIDTYSAQYNLNPAFVAAIVRTESHFDPNAQSGMGARGLMQLMEDTAGWVSEKLGDTEAYSFDRMYDPETNLRYGCWYLGFLSEKFLGDPVCVAAAYHTGQTWMRNILNNSAYSQDGRTVAIDRLPDESTRDYAKKVLDAYAVFRQKYGI